MRDPFSLAPPSKPSNIRAPPTAGGAFSAPPPHTANDGFFSSDASPILNEGNHTGMMSSMAPSRHASSAPAPLAPQFPGAANAQQFDTFANSAQQFDTFANSAMGQVAMGYGKKAIEGGLARWLPGATALMSSLRVYFAVNNEYVLKKLWILLMPFGRKRKFERMTLVEAAGHGRQSNGGGSGGGLGVGSGGGGGEGGAALAPPVCDENAPDLYLPTMAFITYVLCMGLVKGMLKEFHPDVLVMVTSSTLCANFLQVFLLKGALYFLVPDAPVSALDLLAYTGYMYVPLVLNCLCGLIGGRTPYFVALAYTAFAMGYFTSCTLRPLLKDRSALGGMGGSGGGGGAAQAHRTYVEYGAVLIQVLLLWWLGPKSF